MADKSPNLRPEITEELFARFGELIVSYALAERLLKAALGVMLSVHPYAIHLMTDRMSSPALLLKMKAINAADADVVRRGEVSNLIDRMEKRSALRNEIAHSTWAPGRRPSSVRPSGIVVRAKGAQVIGFDDGERDYTVDDVKNEVSALHGLAADIVAFLERHGVRPSG